MNELTLVDNPNDDSKESTLDLLSDDKQEDKKDEKEEVAKIEEPEEKEEDNEKEIELENKKDDDLEYHDIPKRKDILAKFPELFKTFPGIEKSIYRERQYSEIFPTPKDAQDASELAKDYNTFQESLLSGSTEQVLSSLKETDPAAYTKAINNLLPTLAKVDEKSYYDILGRFYGGLIDQMWSTASKDNNQTLKDATKLVWEFLGKPDINKYKNLKTDDQPNDEQEKIKQERAELVRERFDGALSNVTERTQNIIKSTVDKNLDPRGQMSPYVKSRATEEVMKLVDESISTDTRFKAILDKHWERAFNENFSSGSLDSIRNALLSKAKTVLREIIYKVRAEALKGNNSGERKPAQQLEDDEPKKQSAASRPATNAAKTDRNSIPKGMSTLDFLNSD